MSVNVSMSDSTGEAGDAAPSMMVVRGEPGEELQLVEFRSNNLDRRYVLVYDVEPLQSFDPTAEEDSTIALLQQGGGGSGSGGHGGSSSTAGSDAHGASGGNGGSGTGSGGRTGGGSDDQAVPEGEEGREGDGEEHIRSPRVRGQRARARAAIEELRHRLMMEAREHIDEHFGHGGVHYGGIRPSARGSSRAGRLHRVVINNNPRLARQVRNEVARRILVVRDGRTLANREFYPSNLTRRQLLHRPAVAILLIRDLLRAAYYS